MSDQAQAPTTEQQTQPTPETQQAPAAQQQPTQPEQAPANDFEAVDFADTPEGKKQVAQMEAWLRDNPKKAREFLGIKDEPANSEPKAVDPNDIASRLKDLEQQNQKLQAENESFKMFQSTAEQKERFRSAFGMNQPANAKMAEMLESAFASKYEIRNDGFVYEKQSGFVLQKTDKSGYMTASDLISNWKNGEYSAMFKPSTGIGVGQGQADSSGSTIRQITQAEMQDAKFMMALRASGEFDKAARNEPVNIALVKSKMA